MKALRHTAEPGQKEPAEAKPGSFRFFEGMRERRYQRIVRNIQSAEQGLEEIARKRKTFALLSSSSQASIVNEDESNWDEAMNHAREYHSCRKTLKSESRAAAFDLFTKTMFPVALLGGASILMLHAAIPGMSTTVDLVIGSIFVLGSILRTWASASTGSEEFVKLVCTAIDEQRASLESERRRLIKKLHGWNQPD
jgi:hypothetical protein